MAIKLFKMTFWVHKMLSLTSIRACKESVSFIMSLSYISRWWSSTKQWRKCEQGNRNQYVLCCRNNWWNEDFTTWKISFQTLTWSSFVLFRQRHLLAQRLRRKRENKISFCAELCWQWFFKRKGLESVFWTWMYNLYSTWWWSCKPTLFQ